jgi:ubiquinone biosynthesis protein UbiJ
MAMSSPNPLFALAGEALELALNRVVALDPAMVEDLAALDGRRLEFGWPQAGLALAITVRDGRLRVGPAGGELRPDLALRGSLAGFVGLLLPRREGALPAGKVEIEGDAELARRLERLAREFAPDWDAAFESAFGPAIGLPLAKAAQGAVAAARTRAGRLAEDTAEYLKTESRTTIAREELDDFLDAVDTLRDDVERAAARIARLRTRV